jgi:hypothetical protein
VPDWGFRVADAYLSRASAGAFALTVRRFGPRFPDYGSLAGWNAFGCLDAEKTHGDDE